MRLSRKAAALSMCCSALVASACEPKRIAVALKPPPERLQCAPAGERPTIPPEYRIDWNGVSTVAQARSEHDRYVASVRTREGVVAGYVLKVEGELFLCASNAQWLRDWYAATN
jgi:hypothetical protein